MNNRSLQSDLISSLPPKAHNVLVAVSGGVDSVVLLHCLCQLRQQLSLRLKVIHLNHNIRRESTADADFVRDLCLQLQVECEIESYDVPRLAQEQKVSLEMAGRNARRQLFQRAAKKSNCDLVALAHHQDDQIETFMLRLVRGSGVAGLASMKVLNDNLWRPLLHCSRAQIVDYAKHNNLSWVEDASNADPVYLRNRIRHKILPLLKDINPGFNVLTAGLIDQLQQDSDYWNVFVVENFGRFVVSVSDGLRLNRQALVDSHETVRVRIIREALKRVRKDLSGIENKHIQAIIDLLLLGPSQGQLDLPGCWVARRYETLWLRDLAPEVLPDYNKVMPLPGVVVLPDGRHLCSSFACHIQGESKLVAEFNLQQIQLPLTIRSWRPGDRFHPQGMTGRKKVKDYLGDAKVEKEDRQRLLVLAAGEEILWLIGQRRSALAGVDGHCQQILRVELVD